MTVHKHTPDEKLGVAVAVSDDKLFIHKVAPNRFFAGTAYETDALVVSTNGVSFWNKPSAKEALSIAKEAQNIIVLAVMKRIVAPIKV
jgi:hypothetical protein